MVDGEGEALPSRRRLSVAQAFIASAICMCARERGLLPLPKDGLKLISFRFPSVSSVVKFCKTIQVL